MTKPDGLFVGLHSSWETEAKAWRAKAEALYEENERLREALTGCIADLDRHAKDQFEGVWLESDFESLLSPYRAALTPEATDGQG